MTMREIRLHGRGGQGVAGAAEMLAAAFLKEGKHATAFPMFGFERRGAPVTSFVRYDDAPIRTRTQIYRPNSLVIADPSLTRSAAVFDGLQPHARVVLNTALFPDSQAHSNIEVVGVVDATGLALRELGAPITNTCMLGAFARTTGWLDLDSILAALSDYFSGALLEKNVAVTTRGFQEVEVTSYA